MELVNNEHFDWCFLGDEEEMEPKFNTFMGAHIAAEDFLYNRRDDGYYDIVIGRFKDEKLVEEKHFEMEVKTTHFDPQKEWGTLNKAMTGCK